MTTPSPCRTCVSDAPCPCGDFIAWEDLTIPVPRECLVCVDIEVLVLSGELPEQVAARMGMHPDSVTRHLKGHQRADLLPKAVTW